MTLSGKHLQRLRDAFVSAYDTDSLMEFLAFNLNRRLDTLVAVNANFETITFQLLSRAEREGWLWQLVDSAMAERSQNVAFVTVCKNVLDKQAEQHSPTISSEIPPTTSVPSTLGNDELRRRMTERLNRTEVNVLWFDLFGTRLDDDLPGRSVAEYVVELLSRSAQRSKRDELVAQVRRSYPHVLDAGPQSASPVRPIIVDADTAPPLQGAYLSPIEWLDSESVGQFPLRATDSNPLSRSEVEEVERLASGCFGGDPLTKDEIESAVLDLEEAHSFLAANDACMRLRRAASRLSVQQVLRITEAFCVNDEVCQAFESVKTLIAVFQATRESTASTQQGWTEVYRKLKSDAESPSEHRNLRSLLRKAYPELSRLG